MIFTQALDIIRAEIVALFAQNAALFQSIGMNLFRAFATILIVWAGVKAALNAASGGPGFDFGKFAEFLMAITFGYAMITYYTQPIPGIGVSFYHLITDQAFDLADKIGGQTQIALHMKIDSLIHATTAWKFFTGFSISGYLTAAIILIVLSLLELVVFAVIAFGYIAIGVLTLIGPVFIPFFILPKLDFLFWGWFKSFFQYAFYPVIASAFLFIMSKLLLELLSPFDATSFTDYAYAAAKLPFLFIIAGAGIFGALKIPVLVNHIFSGSAGEGGGGVIQMAAGAAIRGVL